MAWKDRILGRRGERFLEAVNLAVYTAVAVAIVVLANWFVDRHNRRWDLTPNQSYSLSPQTTKVLKELKNDLTIYVFDRESGFRGRRDLLDNYSALTHRVTVRYVDPDRQPSLAGQFGIRNYGTVVVAGGDRHFEAQSSTEEGVTNAIVRLLKGQKTVYFIQGHGERDVDSSDRAGYGRVKKQLENENRQVKTLVLLQKMEVPADCSLLVIAGPRNDFLAQEVETIKKYLTGGGRALFLLDPGMELTNLAKLLADWNVTLRNDLAIDENPVAQLVGASPSMPLILKYGSSPIVQPLARTATLFPLTRSFEVGKEYKAGVSAESLCETSPDSFGVADFDPKVREVRYRAGKDTKGPLSVAVAGTIAGEGEKKTEGRFVA
ncbi:MAG: GldG family protein, partial [Acidobacteriia bacterium]|nr:GldG family protein [Terriglobia bacterium]